MSVSKWAYTPDKCDGDYCYGDCDNCPKANEDESEDNEDEKEDDSRKVTNRELMKHCKGVDAQTCGEDACTLKAVCDKWKPKHHYTIPSMGVDFIDVMKPEWLDAEADE